MSVRVVHSCHVTLVRLLASLTPVAFSLTTAIPRVAMVRLLAPLLKTCRVMSRPESCLVIMSCLVM